MLAVTCPNPIAQPPVRRRWLWTLGVALIASIFPDAPADAATIRDRIVAVVNTELITLSELKSSTETE
jgi:hypothetical protein